MATRQLDLEPIASELPVKQDAFMVLIDQAVKGGAQADVVGKMLDHYERFQKMQAKKAFDEAMQNFKNSVPAVVKNRIADMGKFKIPYADIEGVCDTIEPHMIANGFDKRWTTEPSERGIVMCCIIKHIAGHSETTILPPAPPEKSGAKNDLHALASSFTYLQRYSLLMALGMAPRGVDDDGNGSKQKEMAGLDDWCTKIEDAHDYQEMRSAYDKAFAIAMEERNQKAKDALIAARDAWRKKRGMK